MTALSFPESPTIGQIYSENNRIWFYNGKSWVSGIVGVSDIKLFDNDQTNYITLNAPNAISSNFALTFPNNDGNTGQVLSTDGSGILSWIDAGGTGTSVTTNIVTGTTQNAVKDNRYILTNVAATTVTLPSSPTVGDTIYISVMNNLSTNIVARNGNKIMSLNEDMTIDVSNLSFGLTYIDANIGWILV